MKSVRHFFLRVTCFLGVLTILGWSSSTVSAAVLQVPADFSSIQAAMDAAADLDTVLVAPGSYVGEIDFGSKSVVLLSSGGARSTVLAGSGANSPVVMFGKNSHGTLQGFAVTDGLLSGIFGDSAAPRILSCIITRNIAYNGGGIFLANSQGALIQNNRIYRNQATAYYGGAINIDAGVADTIRNNLIYANSGFGDIRSFSHFGAIHDNTISSNSVSTGIELRLDGQLDVRSNIVCFTTGSAAIYDDAFEPGTILAQYNGTFSNVPKDYNFSVDSTNLFVPAQFVDSANNDYHLAVGSPYIDAGDPNPIYNDADLSRNDIGADLSLIPDSLVTEVACGTIANRHVPAEYATIQAAIDAANQCDTVFVDPGNYNEFINFHHKSVVVKSTGGAVATVISGDGITQQPVISFESGSRGSLIGFTVTRGLRSGVWGNSAGPRISSCVITENRASNGGGIFLSNSQGAVIENCRIYRNRATGYYGGAINIDGGVSDTIRNNLIYANSGFGDIRSYSLYASIHDNTISSNSYSTGIELRLDGQLDVRSNIVCFTTGSAAIYDDPWESGTVDAHYNGTFSNEPVNYNFAVDGTNLTVPAQFVDSANNDYHLMPGSPYIDAGDPNSFFNDSDNSRNDIGADLSLIPDSILSEAQCASAVTRLVPGQYATIQEAMNASDPCDTILVSPGTYSGHVNFGSKNVILCSTDGASATVLSGTGESMPVVQFGYGSQGTLKGFTVTNGFASGISGIHAAPRILSCVITGNSANNGGGIFLAESEGSLIADNRIYRNSATYYYGGAINIDGGIGDTIRNNLIYANSGFGDIRSYSLFASIHDNTISSNSTSTGIELRLDGLVDVRSNIVCFTTGSAAIYDDPVESGVINAQYNGTFANLPMDYNFPVDSTNLFVPAQFVDSAANDYHLAIGSPYIDAGDPDAVFNDANLSRNDIGVDLSRIPDSVCCLPVVERLNCCVGQTGNIDCSPDDMVDIGDLTALVDHLFITFTPICCFVESDVNGDSSVDILDLTILVEHLFISFSPLNACQQ
jgi:hypothetical protein